MLTLGPLKHTLTIHIRFHMHCNGMYSLAKSFHFKANNSGFVRLSIDSNYLISAYRHHLNKSYSTLYCCSQLQHRSIGKLRKYSTNMKSVFRLIHSNSTYTTLIIRVLIMHMGNIQRSIHNNNNKHADDVCAVAVYPHDDTCQYIPFALSDFNCLCADRIINRINITSFSHMLRIIFSYRFTSARARACVPYKMQTIRDGTQFPMKCLR